MHQQELRGKLKHRTEFSWARVGRTVNGLHVVSIEDNFCFLGGSDGWGNNCFIHAIMQCLDIVADAGLIRRELMSEFQDPCGSKCRPHGVLCTPDCTKVYGGADANYLSTEHWDAVVRLVGKHSAEGRRELDPSMYCLRVIELTWQDNGAVLGDPLAPVRLTVARENGNHFVPVLRFRAPVHNYAWLPW